jgi:hypothetical protein
MTIYIINGKPHVAVENYFKEISHQEYYMLLESNEKISIEDVNIYD